MDRMALVSANGEAPLLRSSRFWNRVSSLRFGLSPTDRATLADIAHTALDLYYDQITIAQISSL